MSVSSCLACAQRRPDRTALVGCVLGPDEAALDGVNLIPYLTGKNEAAPHEAMFWRWRSQAAVLEFPWKLIHLGAEGRYLFNVTKPDGELAVNNLIQQHPEIAARLEERFKQWSATNKPPGPPDPHNGADIAFFADHVDKSLPSAGRRSKGEKGNAAAPDDWLCRNAATVIKDGALLITPAAGGPSPFLTHSKLKLEGPVTVKMRLRAPGGKGGTIHWRSKGQNEFQSGQSVGFELADSPDWQDVTTTLPAGQCVIHLRIMFAGRVPVAIESIELTAGESRVFADWKSARTVAP